jgi:hypothetical protein
MYINPQHELADHEAIPTLLASHPLGAWAE